MEEDLAFELCVCARGRHGQGLGAQVSGPGWQQAGRALGFRKISAASEPVVSAPRAHAGVISDGCLPACLTLSGHGVLGQAQGWQSTEGWALACSECEVGTAQSWGCLARQEGSGLRLVWPLLPKADAGPQV